jgi:hypothetical protein
MSLLYNLTMAHTENTASKNSSVVACLVTVAETFLSNHYLAIDNFCQLHYFDFQTLCHSILLVCTQKDTILYLFMSFYYLI